LWFIFAGIQAGALKLTLCGRTAICLQILGVPVLKNMIKIKCNSLTLNTETGLAEYCGKKVKFKLGCKDFELLKCLMQNKNKRVSYSDLLITVEPDDLEKTIVELCPNGLKKQKQNIPFLIRNLKKKLEITENLFRNKAGKGYKLVCKK